MTINHKPENTTKTNAAHPSLGKLTDEQDHHNLKNPWAIVEGAGCDDEQVVSYHASLNIAAKRMAYNYSQDEIDGMPVAIMKVNADGTLTTEY